MTTAKDLLPAIKKEASPAIKAAETIEISAETMPEATSLLSVLNRAKDAMTTSKELLTKPLNTALKEIRSRYKPIEEQLDDAIGLIRGKMSKYQTDYKALADAEAAKIAARVAPGRGNLSAETATKKIEEIAKPDKEVHTDAGSVEFVSIKKFEVVDFAALPNDYKLVNDMAIRNAMRQGIQLLGVRYYTEQVPKNIR